VGVKRLFAAFLSLVSRTIVRHGSEIFCKRRLSVAHAADAWSCRLPGLKIQTWGTRSFVDRRMPVARVSA
jgi:hypothetical protein